ncbi:helix-turn-helix transcriptional regulator [Modestobacter marinus]|uniref:helix-turn-helix transcriptional regulator n=1 Tax=Modestobacter marinus TaxID=477641 RepID=UPI001C94B1F1|nr:helix-turn-helix transcriptional regulator [Modestobacter marinus]
MGRPGLAELLDDGRRALERADWESARSAFAAASDSADGGEHGAEAGDGLAQALWFQGSVVEAIAVREHTFDRYVRAGRCDDAARVAVWVAHQHALGGRASAARGWLARAERALAGLPTCAGHGWVAVERARQATRVEEQLSQAARAVEVGRAVGSGDLEVLAVSLLGRAEVRAGHRDAGLRLLEEAMAAATAGRVRSVHTLGEAYCNLVLACSGAGEWERATEWCELVEGFAEAHRVAPLFGACRTVHADLLIVNGRWAEAEDALRDALATHSRHIPELSAPTVASLAELRVQQGRLSEAEELLAGREEHPAALRALALLRIAAGRPHQAVTLLERGLGSTGDDIVAATRLLAPLVDAHLALGDLAGARSAAAGLTRRAEESGIRLLAARADLAAAQVVLGAGGAAEAVEPARRALAAFRGLLMPLDAGMSRLALARAVAGTDPDSAREEARAALGAFRRLGAVRAADTATGLLRQLGEAPGGRARAAGSLTAREQEVLELIAEGMSNAGIAHALVISERTAGHHVSHILAKLGARNRAEAAAYAVRTGSRGRAS